MARHALKWLSQVSITLDLGRDMQPAWSCGERPGWPLHERRAQLLHLLHVQLELQGLEALVHCGRYRRLPALHL